MIYRIFWSYEGNYVFFHWKHTALYVKYKNWKWPTKNNKTQLNNLYFFKANTFFTFLLTYQSDHLFLKETSYWQ